MNKTNKILMRAVAILLCLVLISISVVSSVFARYVIAKDTSTTIKLNKFGVNLGLTLSDEFVEFLGGEEVVADMMTVNGDSISINIPNLKMAPGDEFFDAIHFTFSGEAKTKCKIHIDVDIYFANADFTIPKPIGGVGMSPKEIEKNVQSQFYFPLGLMFKYKTSTDVIGTKNLLSPWNTSNKQMNSEMFVNMIDDMVDVVPTGSWDLFGKGIETDVSAEKVFSVGDEIVLHTLNEIDKDSANNPIYETNKNIEINDLYYGIYWPFEAIDSSDNKHNFDAISVYVADIKRPIINYSFTISIEQVSDDYITPDVDYGI